MELALLAIIVHLILFLWLLVSAFTRSVVWGILVLLFSPLSALAFGIGYFRDVKLPFLLYLASVVFVIASFAMITEKQWQFFCANKGSAFCQKFGLINPSPVPDLGIVPPGVAPSAPPAILPPPDGATTAPTPANNTVAPVTPAVPATATPASQPATTAAPAKPAEAPASKKTDATSNFPRKHSDAPVDPLQVKKQAPPPETEKINPANVGRYLNRYLVVTLTNKVERRGMLKKVDNTNIYLERKWEAKMSSVSYTVSRAQIKSIQVLKKPPKEEQ